MKINTHRGLLIHFTQQILKTSVRNEMHDSNSDKQYF